VALGCVVLVAADDHLLAWAGGGSANSINAHVDSADLSYDKIFDPHPKISFQRNHNMPSHRT
jgi:hypothetical protein